jgi:hypothetical protein
MKRVAGQAGRAAVAIIHGAGMLVMTVVVVAMLALGALAYRLSLGDLEIPWAATRLANAVSGEDVEIHIGQAQLAWAGFKSGSRAPLFLQLGDIVVTNAGGALLATLPQAQLAFSLGALFAHQTPIYVDSQNAHVMGSNVPVSLLAGIRLAAGFTLASADLWVTLGAGQLGPPGYDEPLAGGKFLLSITPTDIRLDHAALTLTPFGHSTPVLLIAASAHKSGAWHGAVTLSAAAVQAADLPHYWPRLMVPTTRSWVMQNITSGTAEDARFTLGLSAPPHLATIHLDSAAGGFNADNATLIWLSGVQPLTGLNGKFALTDADDVDITAATGHLGGITVTNGKMHIAGVSQSDQLASLSIPVSGTVQDTFAVLNGRGLGLMKTVPPPIPAATGDMTGTVQVTLPLQNVTSTAAVKMKVATVLTNITLPLPLPGVTLRNGALTVDATLRNLSVKGDASLFGEPASLAAAVQFSGANGGGGTVIFDMKTTLSATSLKHFGWDNGSFIQGNMPVKVQVATKTASTGRVLVTADLTGAALALPVFGWTKPAGKPGSFSFAASINGSNFAGIQRIDSIDASAPGLAVETTTTGNAINLAYVRIGNTEGSGRIVPPSNAKAPWMITLRGNALDLSPVVNPPHLPIAAATNAGQPNVAQPAAARQRTTRPQPPSGFLWNANAHFDRLLLAKAPAPELSDFNFAGNGQGNFLFQGNATALVEGGKPVQLTVAAAPGYDAGNSETLRLQTGDGGTLLRALGAFEDLSGGDLDLTASFGVLVPTQGVTKITNFRLLNAPALGKILQAVTVLGIPEAASGPGLLFNRMVVPFSIDDQMMTLKEARAYSASLGFTASGTIDLDVGAYDIHGTVVPAYALNALPGKIPLIGRLFSPEKGGGLFAMRYTMKGPFSDPKVTVNPLSAFTPGFLRGIFGIGQKTQPK